MHSISLKNAVLEPVTLTICQEYMTNINTETETVVKKILPYLIRRGYDLTNDLDFETGITVADRYSKGAPRKISEISIS